MKKYASILVSCAALLLGAGCASPAPYAAPPSQPILPQAAAPVPAPATSSPSSQERVYISGFSFQPASLTVKVGTTVVWTNQDQVTHTITANDGSFDSGTLAPNATYSHAFNQAGSFSYHCNIHPSMQATIIVQ